MMSGPALLKKKQKLAVLMEAFPDRRSTYEEQLAQIEARLIEIKACRLCGRPLKGEKSMAEGVGPECAKKEAAKSGE